MDFGMAVSARIRMAFTAASSRAGGHLAIYWLCVDSVGPWEAWLESGGQGRPPHCSGGDPRGWGGRPCPPAEGVARGRIQIAYETRRRINALRASSSRQRLFTRPSPRVSD